MTKTARYFVGEDAAGVYIPGVPLRDLDDDEFDALDDTTQATIDASGLFRKTRPTTARRASTAAAAPDDDAPPDDAPPDDTTTDDKE